MRVVPAPSAQGKALAEFSSVHGHDGNKGSDSQEARHQYDCHAENSAEVGERDSKKKERKVVGEDIVNDEELAVHGQKRYKVHRICEEQRWQTRHLMGRRGVTGSLG
eukprot:CAMPEP_0118985122 /NCGR_PEP_ID=MMETSP1173-20130426/39224_1 /TAXON_ID=1034831 /ORGANISM="Rhizochromulina marina cf, Strain CCMP1243" /LENGTH=106 /DNA_ID=CAMNT_0006935819 /DNA_START=82 /DNA_END=400 /DNA_ORIENTATION=-